jgi:hypothetical protein
LLHPNYMRPGLLLHVKIRERALTPRTEFGAKGRRIIDSCINMHGAY